MFYMPDYAGKKGSEAIIKVGSREFTCKQLSDAFNRVLDNNKSFNSDWKNPIDAVVKVCPFSEEFYEMEAAIYFYVGSFPTCENMYDSTATRFISPGYYEVTEKNKIEFEEELKNLLEKYGYTLSGIAATRYHTERWHI